MSMKGMLVNKSQLIDTLAARYDGNRKAAAQALESVLDTITREVAKGEKVAITGFGSFEKRVRESRWVRNPRTGERIKAKKTAIPKFSAGADLKAVVSGAKKLPKLTMAAATAPAKAAAPKRTSTSNTAKKSTPAKRSGAARKSPAKKSAAKKTSSSSTAKKAPARKTAAKKASPAKKTSTAKKSSAAKKGTAKKTAKKS
jgi:DNA-binding protein HU-beta